MRNGFSGLLRNNAGNPILSYSAKVGSDSVMEQELRGIETGLKVTKELCIKHIAIGSDSTLVVNIVAGIKAEPWHQRNLVRCIKNLCNEF